MAAITHVESMIDYALIQYGQHVTNSLAARADLLAWMQGAEEELWVAAPWSWREIEYTGFAFVSGTVVYTMDADLADILDLYNSDGAEIHKIPPRIFRRYYGVSAAAATGPPTRWTHDPVQDTGGQLVIRVWPTPGAADTACRVIGEKRRAVLVDAITSFSNFPLGRRMLVVLKAMKNLAMHEGKTELQGIIQGDIDRFLSGLSAKDAEHFQGRL